MFIKKQNHFYVTCKKDLLWIYFNIWQEEVLQFFKLFLRNILFPIFRTFFTWIFKMTIKAFVKLWLQNGFSSIVVKKKFINRKFCMKNFSWCMIFVYFLCCRNGQRRPRGARIRSHSEGSYGYASFGIDRKWKVVNVGHASPVARRFVPYFALALHDKPAR